jgi:hypothetical protein
MDGPGFEFRYGQQPSRLVLVSTHSLIPWVPGFISRGQSQWGMKMTTHLYIGPSLRIGGALPLLPLHAFTVRMTTLPLYVSVPRSVFVLRLKAR